MLWIVPGPPRPEFNPHPMLTIMLSKSETYGKDRNGVMVPRFVLAFFFLCHFLSFYFLLSCFFFFFPSHYFIIFDLILI